MERLARRRGRGLRNAAAIRPGSPQAGGCRGVGRRAPVWRCALLLAGSLAGPETFVIDRQGRIRYKHVGAITERVFRDVVEPLLGEAAG